MFRGTLPRGFGLACVRLFALCAPGIFWGCAGGGHGEIRLSYSIFFPPSHVQTRTAQEWASEIEARTGGKVKITVYSGETLTKSTRIYDGVVNGVSDLGMSAFAYTRGRFPVMEGLDLPLGYPDGKTATRAANAVFDTYRPTELGDVEVMYLHAHGPGVLAGKKRLTALSGLAGMKIRGTGLSGKIVSSLGAVPVSMGQGDTYEALQRGVVEATLCPIETLKGWRQAEVIDYVLSTKATGYTTTMYVVMNRDSWGALPDDIQTVFREVNLLWRHKQGQAWDTADDEAKELLRTLDKPTLFLSAEEEKKFVDAVNPMLEEWAASLEGRGLPGNAVLADLRGML